MKMKFSYHTQSWGRLERPRQAPVALTSRHHELPDIPDTRTALPYGLGRSYGDSCLNANGILLTTSKMDKLISFDPESGVVRCEAGLSLAELLEIIVPKGWFLPVTPGTKFITVGGAIANDVHGKNHHVAGNFGHHVQGLELLRSNGARHYCSPSENRHLFEATIGGLGLTGLITWAEFKLKPIHNPFIQMESIKYKNVDEFFDIAADSDKDYEYTVSWIDCLSNGDQLGRGLFMRGNSAPAGAKASMKSGHEKVSIPLDAPGFLLNSASIKAFNTAYYNKQQKRVVKQTTHYDPFFYPLDAAHQWNRLYGKAGFYQYQCIVPFSETREPIREILRTISRSGQGSFLAVLKVFGEVPAKGMMSFPKPGVTLALDFANRGQKTLQLFKALDEIVARNQGSIYVAKDARMSADHFKQFYPRWKEFSQYVDPKFSSSFWRRVNR